MQNEHIQAQLIQAGIDMTRPVKVIKAGGGPGGVMEDSEEMSSEALIEILAKSTAEFESEGSEGDEIWYDFDAEDSYPGAKLAVLFSDAYEYIIYQE